MGVPPVGGLWKVACNRWDGAEAVRPSMDW